MVISLWLNGGYKDYYWLFWFPYSDSKDDSTYSYYEIVSGQNLRLSTS